METRQKKELEDFIEYLDAYLTRKQHWIDVAREQLCEEEARFVVLDKWCKRLKCGA